MKLKIIIIVLFLVTFSNNAFSSENQKLIDFARDSVEVCIIDLQGGKSRELLNQKGYKLDWKGFGIHGYNKLAIAASTAAGKPLSLKPSIVILSSPTRKIRSKCQVILSGFALTTSNLIYKEILKYVVTLNYLPKIERNSIIYRKDDFVFSIKGQQQQVGASVQFRRLSK